MKVNRAHKIRVDASKWDANFFTRCIGTARFSYNWALEQWQDIYGMGGRPTETGLRRYLNHIKKEAYPWMYKVPKSIPQQAIKNAGTTFSSKEGRDSRKQRRRVWMRVPRIKMAANQKYAQTMALQNMRAPESTQRVAQNPKYEKHRTNSSHEQNKEPQTQENPSSHNEPQRRN